MKDKFPYQGNEVLITQEMCDLNEHMNVLYYAQIFEEEFPFYSSLGFSSNYFEQGFSFFTLEMNIRYLKEMRKGEVALPGFRYFAVKPKLIHRAIELYTRHYHRTKMVLPTNKTSKVERKKCSQNDLI